MKPRFTAAAVLVLATGPALAAEIPVTTCGQQIPAVMHAVLMAELSCSSGPGVLLGSGSSLDLNGFSIIGNTAAPQATGVECSAGCRVDGPGTVREFSGTGIHAYGALQVSGVEVRDNASLGLSASAVVISDSLVSGNATGVYASTTASLTNVDVVANHATGVNATKVELDGCDVSNNDFYGALAVGGGNASVVVRSSTITGNGKSGIYNIHYSQPLNGPAKARGRTRVIDSQVTDNAEEGVHAAVAKVENSSFDRNETGIYAGRAMVRSSSMSDNTENGLVVGQRGGSSTGCKVESSTLNGNGRYGLAGQRNVKVATSQLENNVVTDVYSTYLPKLRETICGTSAGNGDGDWDVCTLD